MNMIATTKSLTKSFISLFGVQVHRIPTQEQIEIERHSILELERKKALYWLKTIEIKTILDIGANTGQFAAFIHEICPDAMIYSFEPLGDCYEQLIANFKDVPRFKAFNLALGDMAGEVEMYRNEHSPSSSLLSMEELHKKSFPYTREEQIQKINVARLDEFATNLEIQFPMLIKLDVQGFEDKVIREGINTIKKAEIIIIELSVEHLYEAQPLFDDIYRTLFNLGFQYKGNYDQLHNPIDGRVLQMDGIFVKR